MFHGFDGSRSDLSQIEGGKLGIFGNSASSTPSPGGWERAPVPQELLENSLENCLENSQSSAPTAALQNWDFFSQFFSWFCPKFSGCGCSGSVQIQLGAAWDSGSVPARGIGMILRPFQLKIWESDPKISSQS